VRFVVHRRPASRRRNRNWIAKGKTHALAATAIAAGAPSVGAPGLGQVHVLTAGDVTSGVPSTGGPAIGQTHALAAMDIATSAPSAGAPALGGTPPPILIEAESFDVPRTDRRRIYELGLRADLEKAERTLQEPEARAAHASEARWAALPRNKEGPSGSETWSPRLSSLSPTAAQALSVAHEEEDDEDALLLVL
jgi:hypothetical protein